MHAMTHSVANGPSPKQLNWWLYDLVLLSNVGPDCIWGTSGNEKWGELGNGFATGDANTKSLP